MLKYFFFRILIILLTCNFSHAEDGSPAANVMLNPAETELKSAFANFLARKSDKDGGTFLKNTITALETRVISEGMELNFLKQIFSDKIIIPERTVESKIVRDVGMVPLQGRFWDKTELPGVPGPIWFLIFDINKKNQVHHLSLRYMTVKDLYMNWHGDPIQTSNEQRTFPRK